MPFGRSAITGMSDRTARLKLIALDRKKSLADIIAAVSPEIARIYKLDRCRIPILPSIRRSSIIQHSYPRHELIKVLELLLEIDPRRFSGPTPNSARLPLSVYFGSPVVSPTESTAPREFSIVGTEHTSILSLTEHPTMSRLIPSGPSVPTDRGALEGSQNQLDFLAVSMISALSREVIAAPCA